MRGMSEHGKLSGRARSPGRWMSWMPVLMVPVGAEWARDGRTWIVAVDYDSGRRVVFGQAGAPVAALPDAVVASCSIPGWYRPMVIGGRRYVDGCLRSATSAGLLAEKGLDEVYVLAPMASLVVDRPWLPHERLERRLRWLITLGLRREVEACGRRGPRSRY